MIQTTETITATIRADKEGSISELLADLLHGHKKTAEHQRQLWNRYMLKDVPIMNRKQVAYEKVNRKIANDFYGDIVDTKVGYMGNEVSVSLDRGSYEGSGQFDIDRGVVHEFSTFNSTEDLNSDLLRDAATVGIGYRLLYVRDGQNEVRMKNLVPWEVIYIYDQSIDEPQLVLRYYELEDTADYSVTYTVVEWYDDREVRYYIDDGNYNFRLDPARGEVQSHLFTGVPIIPFLNNRDMLAEPEKVTGLIDAYDAILSSTASEFEQLRMAYMYAKGAGLQVDKEFINNLEQTGVFALPEDGDVGFISKEVAAEAVKLILDEIRKNIYQFAKSIDMSKDFGGDMRVIGWQVALLNLENSSKITERKFQKSLSRQYDLITNYWSRFKGVNIDPSNLEFVFTRNFPRDLYSEAQTLEILTSQVSKKTAFGLMSFIDDPDAEIDRLDEEQVYDPFRMVPDANTRPTYEQPQDME